MAIAEARMFLLRINAVRQKNGRPRCLKPHAEVHAKRNRIRVRACRRPIEANWQDGLNKIRLEEAAFDRPALVQEGCKSELRGVDIER